MNDEIKYSLKKSDEPDIEIRRSMDLDGSVTDIIRKNLEVALSEVSNMTNGIFTISDFASQFSFDGSVIIGSDPSNGYYTDFFKKKGRRSKKGGKYILRGSRYITAVDPALEVRQKLTILRDDFVDALDILTKDGSDIVHEHFIEQTALLDYMKNASVTLFNALIQREKIGEFKLQDQRYQVLRSMTYQLAKHSVKAYYAHIIGDTNTYTSSLMKLIENYEHFDVIIKYIEEKYIDGVFSSKYFTRPEAGNPLIILASVYTAVRNVKYTPDTIIGLPSGGTELAFVQQYAYLYLKQVDTRLLLLPLSLHSIKDAFNIDNIEHDTFFVFLDEHKDVLQGKRVLIVEDNSSTGRTIQTLVDLLNSNNEPSDIDVSVAEADVIRSQIDINSPKRDFIASTQVYTHSVHMLPISRVLKPKVDLKEIEEKKRIVRKYKLKLQDAKDYTEEILYSAFLEMATHPTQEFLHSLDDENSILKFRHTFLSNFYTANVEHDGIMYKSVEHAYQAQKFTIDILRTVKAEHIAEVNEEMRMRGHPIVFESATDFFTHPYITSGNTKIIADILRKYGYVREDWDNEKMLIMTDLLIQKYKHKDLAKKLKDTGNRYLVEGNTWGDTLWGVSGGIGKNLLGLLLMELRKRL